MPDILISKVFTFESAHWLPSFPEGHKCRRLHGHSFRVEIFVTGHLENGIIMDYGELKKIVAPYINLLDHRLLNEVGEELNAPLLRNPTSENLALWFHEILKAHLPGLKKIILHETCTARCVLEC